MQKSCVGGGGTLNCHWWKMKCELRGFAFQATERKARRKQQWHFLDCEDSIQFLFLLQYLAFLVCYVYLFIEDSCSGQSPPREVEGLTFRACSSWSFEVHKVKLQSFLLGCLKANFPNGNASQQTRTLLGICQQLGIIPSGFLEMKLKF